jgi:hypothetical protein
MTRKELLRLMPKNGDDLEGANLIIALGYPSVDPVLHDIVYCLRIAESSVADAFATFVATIGESAVTAIGHELGKENCWLRHRVFNMILPKWPDEAVLKLRNILTMIATQPDSYDNDIRSLEILAERRLAEIQWLQDWLDFKLERWKERNRLLTKAQDLITKCQHPR